MTIEPAVRMIRFPGGIDRQLPPPSAEMWTGRLASRAFVLDARAAQVLADDIGRIFSALCRLPSTHAGGTAGFLSEIGVPRKRTAILERFARDAIDSYLRADLYLTSDGWRLLEMNIASDLGLVDQHLIAERAVEGPEATALSCFTISTAEAVRDAALRRVGPRGTSCSVRMVIAVPPDRGEEFRKLVASTAAALSDAGLDVAVAELSRFSWDGNALWFGGETVDVVLRYFHIDDLLDPLVSRQAGPVLAAMEAGRVVVLSNPNSSIASNKGALAHLWVALEQGVLEEAEAAAVRRLVQRTRFVGPGEVSKADARYVRDQRCQLVVKPATGSSGVGVVCGWEVDDHTWARSVARAAADHGAVLQEREQSMPFDLDGDGSTYSVVWGPFLIDGKLAGMATRAQVRLRRRGAPAAH